MVRVISFFGTIYLLCGNRNLRVCACVRRRFFVYSYQVQISIIVWRKNGYSQPLRTRFFFAGFSRIPRNFPGGRMRINFPPKAARARQIQAETFMQFLAPRRRGILGAPGATDAKKKRGKNAFARGRNQRNVAFGPPQFCADPHARFFPTSIWPLFDLYLTSIWP